ncbi:ABC-type multidrug transport system fused ATPase/permease subunit [Geomicrobium halophilum]|uniref:ABC-type multidrug transport system fused ATPase/permease subunit n=1 Tax=Geomicrobium halophilum TaxID=549000 RepID=A0A841PNL2_9BACL|nr:ABC transporter ATP-binding protein [Geomicrobium halophilum]MBB6450427.1 ABC-type multidrug transport system fused ATPase/permease subunit [Geomicrobium halophilum]
MKTAKMLYELFGKKEKKKFSLLFVLMVIGALFETAGVGLIVPFVGIITNPEQISENAFLSYVYTLFNFESTNAFLIFATLFLLVFYIIKNIYLTFFFYVQYKIIYNEQVKLSRRMLKAYLFKPYIFHLERNTAQLLRNVDQEVKKIFNQIVVSGFKVLTEITVMLSILTLLFFMAPLPTLLAVTLLGGGIIGFFAYFKNKIATLGQERQTALGRMIKWVNQAFGSTKEVKVLGKERFFVDSFTSESKTYARSMRFYKLMKEAPRMFVETVVVGTILFIVLIIMMQSQDLTTLISTVALFAMAAFRLMPSINRMVSAITDIRYNRPSLEVVYNDLMVEKVEENLEPLNRENKDKDQGIEKSGRLFKDQISMENVSFQYPNSNQYVIKNVSLSIPIGYSAAFIGPSGSGKTTLVDLMLGVLKPNDGVVKVDHTDIQNPDSLWQKKIGYIPQNIYLVDDTIRRNVAFGVSQEKIDDDKVWESLRQAQLDEHVRELPKGLDTEVGERGTKLSGGQKQRIGIARALYGDPEVLFLDEATSALDHDTEKGIMRAIESLRGEKTIILIAHRLSTTRNCDVIFEMENGCIQNVESSRSSR